MRLRRSPTCRHELQHAAGAVRVLEGGRVGGKRMVAQLLPRPRVFARHRQRRQQAAFALKGSKAGGVKHQGVVVAAQELVVRRRQQQRRRRASSVDAELARHVSDAEAAAVWRPVAVGQLDGGRRPAAARERRRVAAGEPAAGFPGGGWGGGACGVSSGVVQWLVVCCTGWLCVAVAGCVLQWLCVLLCAHVGACGEELHVSSDAWLQRHAATQVRSARGCMPATHQATRHARVQHPAATPTNTRTC